MVLVAIVADKLLHSEWFTAILLQRLIATPGLLTGMYVEFFSAHPKAMLAHSVLAPFLAYPYDREPSFLIGRAYFGSETVQANANIWADGYANFGWAGDVAGFPCRCRYCLELQRAG